MMVILTVNRPSLCSESCGQVHRYVGQVAGLLVGGGQHSAIQTAMLEGTDHYVRRVQGLIVDVLVELSMGTEVKLDAIDVNSSPVFDIFS
jgi:hypothetical protein